MTDHPIPDTALEADIAILGKKGRGKTYTAKGLVERLLDNGRRVCVLDPLSTWWGLKSAADGEREGYPVTVFGGDHADLPLELEMARPLAKMIAGENLPCVLDMGVMRKGELARFSIDFLEELYRLNRDPLTLVLEEADVFAPQNPAKDGQGALLLAEVDRIARRGRAYGFRLMTLTQRPARLHKDVLTQLSTLIALGVSAPQDREAIKAWVEGNGDRDQAKEVFDTLAGLGVGEGWVWAPDLGILDRVSFPRIKTLDTSATPKAGESRVEAKALARPDVDAIRAALAEAIPDDGEADSHPEKIAAPEKVRIRAKAFEEGRQAGREQAWRDGESAIKAEVNAITQELKDLHRRARSMALLLDNTTNPDATAPVLAKTMPVRAPEHGPAEASGDTALPAAAIEWLQAMRDIEPMTLPWTSLAILRGRKARGGHFNTVKRAMLDQGLACETGDAVELTEAGREHTQAPKSAASVIERLSLTLPVLPVAILTTLTDFPKGLSPEEIARRLGKAPRGGHWNTGMRILRDGNVIEGREIIKLQEWVHGR